MVGLPRRNRSVYSQEEKSTMSEPEPGSSGKNAAQENWWDYCPLCNFKLVNQKCKYVCPNDKCNFFMSCSEFDL